MMETTPTKRWPRVAYDRVVDTGVFGPADRIELLGGVLVVREPQGWHYASAVTLRAGDVVTPLAAPHFPIPVVDLVP